ncbi:nucleic acid-binding protein [Neoconidiobolus thromboides FSU 785]|nr:nucleic acid-binding protein [Neoconidiobolus thromboides FSU 785]
MIKIGAKLQLFAKSLPLSLKFKLNYSTAGTTTTIVKPTNITANVEKFSLLDWRVGEIIEVKEHPEATQLYIEKVNIGLSEPITLISGLKGYYKMEELLNRKVIVFCNLKPAKMRGILSSGMLLAIVQKKEDGFLVELIQPNENVEVGTKVTLQEEALDNDESIENELLPLINNKKWNKIQNRFEMKNGNIIYKSEINNEKEYQLFTKNYSLMGNTLKSGVIG